MKNSRFVFGNRNLKALTLISFLFSGSNSFSQTTQAEPVKVVESKTELSEYPTDPVVVPADLKKHAIEQKALLKSIPAEEKSSIINKWPTHHVCPSF